MKCTPLKDDQGNTIGIACGGRRRSPRCVVCKRPSSQLCDYPLKTAGGHERTCDRGLCKRCSRRDDARDRDYCPEHSHPAALALLKEKA